MDARPGVAPEPPFPGLLDFQPVMSRRYAASAWRESSRSASKAFLDLPPAMPLRPFCDGAPAAGFATPAFVPSAVELVDAAKNVLADSAAAVRSTGTQQPE